ncbi:MAG: ABC transporter ATP-binding protein/permease [Defluviitaleaceae bacterium]|nr:ABC transporter ATP-binding protein/permease [Defluviitaleaceae bacterium]
MSDQAQPTQFEEQEFSKNFDAAAWKKIFAFAKRHKKLILGAMGFMVFDAGVDVVLPLTTMYAIDTFIVAREMDTFVPFVFVYLGLIALQTFSIYMFISFTGKIEASVIYDIRREGFRKLQNLSFSYYDKTPVGWIMARVTSDVQRIGDIVAWGVLDVFWTVTMITILVGVMFTLNTQLALILLVIIPPLIIVSMFFQRRIIKAQREVRKTNSKITGAINEGINGARTTKTLTRESGNFDEFSALTSDMRRASIRAGTLNAKFMPVVLSLGSIGLAMVLTNGGHLVMAGAISLGTLAVFVAYSLQMFDPIQHIAHIFSEMQAAQASAERTFSLMETEPDITDSQDVLRKYGDIEHPHPENWEEITGEIVFDDVSFAYNTKPVSDEAGSEADDQSPFGEAEKLLLRNFSLRVKPGEKIALVGETGAGKSTIVNLLCRFYEPTSGQIKIDGVDYRQRSQGWLHSNLGYVLQTPHLFSGSVMDNIRYSKPGATDDEVVEVARKMGAHDFIMKMEGGYGSNVGEGGSKLSTGERQLVSFARAILRNPKIFVLDEATSSIDTQTEALIQDAVDEALRGRTSFIIAHRLSTIRSADRILVIHGGAILESGSHKELLRARGHYYELYTNQIKKEAQERLLG